MQRKRWPIKYKGFPINLPPAGRLCCPGCCLLASGSPAQWTTTLLHQLNFAPLPHGCRCSCMSLWGTTHDDPLNPGVFCAFCVFLCFSLLLCFFVFVCFFCVCRILRVRARLLSQEPKRGGLAPQPAAPTFQGAPYKIHTGFSLQVPVPNVTEAARLARTAPRRLLLRENRAQQFLPWPVLPPARGGGHQRRRLELEPSRTFL